MSCQRQHAAVEVHVHQLLRYRGIGDECLRDAYAAGVAGAGGVRYGGEIAAAEFEQAGIARDTRRTAER